MHVVVAVAWQCRQPVDPCPSVAPREGSRSRGTLDLWYVLRLHGNQVLDGLQLGIDKKHIRQVHFLAACAAGDGWP
jgi:hypothetical protein